MEIKTNIKKVRTLKDFTRICISFVCCLFVLSIYQQFILYQDGVIEKMMNQTIWILLFNHLGFAAVVSFVLLFLFRFLEYMKPGMGFRMISAFYAVFLLSEILLVEGFIHNYSLIYLADFESGFSMALSGSTLVRFTLVVLGIAIFFYLFYRWSSFLSPFIGKMFPFTIVLFLLIMGASVTDKKPINQNKAQEFMANAMDDLFDFNNYEGKEYPLVKTLPSSNGLSDYFMKSKGMPNIAIIVIDGLSSDYLADGKFSGFMPFLDSLTTQSLYWSRFLSNSTSKTDAITNILGSLPHGKNGFTKLENTVNRNTLFGIAKEKGYQTSFYYGGNTALDGLNRFLKEEQVDIVVDKSRFNDTYKLQDTDRAGVTLGYSDFELYKKWGASYLPLDQPKLECFLNLSTSKPFSFPELSEYSAKAQNIKENLHFKPQEERFIKKNIELFAALNYTDTALRSLFEMYQTTKGYGNTIFLITGSSRPYLHKDHIVQERHVPFLLLSPLMKQPKVFENLVSHHDIAPSILQLLSKNMTSKYPKKVAWIGDGLLSQNTNILLPKSGGGLSALVKHNHVIVGRTVSKIDGNLTLHVPEKSFNALLKSNLKHFKALNKYVTTNDKILPITDIIFQSGGKVISKEELVWISSVFNGKNYDNAYKIARELAHDGNYEKALVLAEYILEKTPGHIDAMILQGRIYAWKKHFSKAIAILEAAVDEHPFYHDAYAALLDVYYWSGNNARALHIYQKIKENHIETVELVEKVERCMNQIKGAEETTNGGRLLALEEKDIK